MGATHNDFLPNSTVWGKEKSIIWKVWLCVGERGRRMEDGRAE